MPENPPGHFCLVSGSGEADTELNAFDRALLSAGIGDLNLVKVTSIVPPGANPENPKNIKPGSIVHAAYSCCRSEITGERIAAAVAVGIPGDQKKPGVIMECSGKMAAEELEKNVREMVVCALSDRCVDEYSIQSVSGEYYVKRNAVIIAAVLLW